MPLSDALIEAINETKCPECDAYRGNMPDDARAALETLIQTEIDAAKADMRERCAKVADDGLACFEIAAAIRLLK